MLKNPTYRLVFAGLLAALGLLLPFLTAHAFGVPGTVLLPMHIPVFLTGLLCGPMYGALNGILIPILSSVLTGMPPVFPMLPIMAGELLTYGLVSGLLYHKTRLPLYPSMLIAMVSGRVVYGLIFGALLLANDGPLKALSVTGAVVTGIPGIIIQLVLVPLIVLALRRQLNRGPEIRLIAFEKARKMVKAEEVSCVMIKGNKIIHTASGHGVAPLISVYENSPEILAGAFVVDKIIGKAAAMILALGGAKRAYGEIMSAAAYNYLTGRGIQAEYGERIDVVVNRAGDGMCPLESSVLDLDDPEAGYLRLKETIQRLRSTG
jgi:hypothetical protein